MENDNPLVVITVADITERLHQVSFKGQLYHVPSDELNRIYERQSVIPTRAFLITPCVRALECYGTSNPPICDHDNKCFHGFEVKDRNILEGIAEVIRRDKVIAGRDLYVQQTSDFRADPLAGGLHTKRYVPNLQQTPEPDWFFNWP